MGEPICRNLVKKSGARVVAFDLTQQALARLRDEGAERGRAPWRRSSRSDIVFLCLPSAKHVRAVFEGDGILKNIRSTAGRRRSRHLIGQADPRFRQAIAGRGASWVDAPIARTRQAAQDGTLSVMVGASPELFGSIEPVIRCFATDVTSCGDIGAGAGHQNPQQHGAVSDRQRARRGGRGREALGVDPTLLLETLSKGSADSFALRNHGMKAIVPGNSPERAFSTEYALKDLSYALELAYDAGVKIRGAELIGKVFL